MPNLTISPHWEGGCHWKEKSTHWQAGWSLFSCLTSSSFLYLLGRVVNTNLSWFLIFINELGPLAPLALAQKTSLLGHWQFPRGSSDLAHIRSRRYLPRPGPAKGWSCGWSCFCRLVNCGIDNLDWFWLVSTRNCFVQRRPKNGGNDENLIIHSIWGVLIQYFSWIWKTWKNQL